MNSIELSRAFDAHCQQRDRVQSALNAPIEQVNQCKSAEQLIEIAARYRAAYCREQRIAEWMINPVLCGDELDELIESDRVTIQSFKESLKGHPVRVLRESAIAEIRACLLSEIENEGVLW